MLDISYFENSLSGIFLFMIIIFGDYIGKMFPCGFQKLFRNNIHYKYILSFFILFIAIILSNEKLAKNKSIILLFGITCLLYVWFLFMTKMNVYFFISLLVILFVLYAYIQYYDFHKLEEKEKKTYNIITLIFFILAIVITVVGFLLYYGEKKYEYKKMFSWNTFFFDTVICNNNPPKGTMKDYFLAIFNKNNI
jgi:heme/copper-type cytochrome/quinol oxidase subunit 4